MKFAVMGTGGLGGYFGGVLAKEGQDVTFIARGEHLQAMREHGLKVLSPRGDFVVNPVQATDNPKEVGPVDTILFCVKSGNDVDNALELIQPMMGPETVVIPVLNGIGHMAPMQAQLGERHVLGGSATINAHKSASGVIHHVADSGQYQLEFGEWSGGVSPCCEQIQAILTQAGLTTAPVPNISERMWWKLAVFSGAIVLAVTCGAMGKVWIPEMKAVLHQAVTETVAVAAKKGITLSKTLPDDVVELGKQTAAGL